MAILPIITAPDPVLRQISMEVRSVNDEVKQLMDNMLETMYHDEGIGLAAPQIGVLKRIIVLDLKEVDQDYNKQNSYKYPLFMVNPVIETISNETIVAKEGCLSLPEQVVEVERFPEIKVTYIDYNNNKTILKTIGWLARAIQHEVDHLNGVLLIDYLSSMKKDIALRKLTKIKKYS